MRHAKGGGERRVVFLNNFKGRKEKRKDG